MRWVPAQSLRTLRIFVLSIILAADQGAAVAQDGDGFRDYLDVRTGIKISLPSSVFTVEHQTKLGTNWTAADKSINFDLLAFAKDQQLKTLYDVLRRIRGRELSKDIFQADSFVIAGRDIDGSSFQVEVRESSGLIKGYSIVYEPKWKDKAAKLIDKIAQSFAPFPDAIGKEAVANLAIINGAKSSNSKTSACRDAAAYRVSGLGVAWDQMDADTAIDICRAAITETPDNPKLWAYLARALQKKKGEKNLEEAFSLARRSADKDDPEGLTRLGAMLENGEGAPKNAQEAARMYERAVKAKFPPAQYNLANFYLEGDSVPKDNARALELLEGAAESNYGPALWRLAKIYREGGLRERDPVKARGLLERSVQQFESSAFFDLAYQFEVGEGGPADISKALELYREAAQRGVEGASPRIKKIEADNAVLDQLTRAAEGRKAADVFKLAQFYCDVRPSSRDLTFCLKELERAAILELEEKSVPAPATLQMARRLENGVEKLLPADSKRAVSLIRQAAEIGDGQAAILLGEAYVSGNVIEKSEVEAVRWYKRAGESQQVEAVKTSANKFLDGSEISRNTDLAIQYMERAAELGANDALMSLGGELISGDKLPQNLDRGIALYEKAAEKGNKEALHNLSGLFAEGSGGLSKDDTRATQYYLRSANAGSAQSMRVLALRLIKGLGTPASLTEAANWLAKSIEVSGGSYVYPPVEAKFDARHLFLATPSDDFDEVVIELGRKGFEAMHLSAAVRLASGRLDSKGPRDAYTYILDARAKDFSAAPYALARLVDLYSDELNDTPQTLAELYLEAVADTRDAETARWARHYLYDALLRGKIGPADTKRVLQVYAGSTTPLLVSLWHTDQKYEVWRPVLANIDKLEQLFTIDFKEFEGVLESGTRIWQTLQPSGRDYWRQLADAGNSYLQAVLAKVSETSDIGDTAKLYERIASAGANGQKALDKWRSGGGAKSKHEAVTASGQRNSKLGTCYLASDGKKTSPELKVTVSPNTGSSLSVGEPIKINYTLVQPINVDCEPQLYAVFSFPERSRFEGNGFAALAPGATAPHGIKKWQDRMRVLIPLHMDDSFHQGSFVARAYEVGSFPIEWAIVEVPRREDTEPNQSAYDGVSTVVKHDDAWTVTVEATARAPVLFVQDRFATEQPKQTRYSNSGAFMLKEFTGYYRVFDTRSGALILERSGWKPNFSPTSRFVAAFGGARSEIDTSAIEIVDLYSGEVVHSVKRAPGEEGEAARDYRFGAIAWGLADSVAVLGYNVYGNFQIRQTLIGREADEISSGTCHACSSLSEAVFLDEDNLVVRVAKIERAGSWPDYMAEAYEREISDKTDIDPELTPWESWQSASLVLHRAKEASDENPLSADDAAYAKRFDDLLVESSGIETPYPELAEGRSNWLLGTETPYSHANYGPGENLVETHSEKPLVAQVTKIAAAEPDGNIIMRGEQADTKLLGSQSKAGGIGLGERFLNRLKLFGIKAEGIAPDTTEHAPEETRDYSGNYWEAQKAYGKILQARLEETFKGIAPLFDPRHASNDTHPGCMEGEDTALDPSDVHTVWTWTLASERMMALQNHCTYGSANDAFGHFILLREASKAGQPIWNWITEQKWKEQPLSYYLSTYDPSPLIVRLAQQRYLLVASNGRNPSIVVYDLSLGRTSAVIDNPRTGYLTDQVFLTTDGRRVIQLNSDGQFHIYELANNSHVLSGYYVDDEIVIYDDRRFYDATQEGAHHVFLRFPGLSGYHSFQQFSRTLHHPEIIKARLDGKLIGTEPTLIVPPTLSISGKQVAGDEVGQTVALDVDAQSLSDLASIRIYADGRMVENRPATGRTMHSSVTLKLPAETRWISAIVADSSGTESPVQTISMPSSATKSSAPVGRLFVIAVGTDHYSDKKLVKLNFARKDAENFASAALAAKGAYYSDVIVEKELDRTSLRTTLLDRVRSSLARATEQDTLMLFIAGHGLQDNNGRFYLATPDTTANNLPETALAWDALARALETSRARVIVFIDACHSGSADQAATNDDAVQQLISGKKSITVIAASKGRQNSYEGGQTWGSNGAFTATLVAAAQDRAKTDTNKNGVIELSELYGSIKAPVLAGTQGKQTPWIARNEMVGEIPVF